MNANVHHYPQFEKKYLTRNKNAGRLGEISKRDRRQLTDAIQEFYDGTAKDGTQYAMFTNLVYHTLFDMTAIELKAMYELGKNEPLRDSFTTEDLRKVVKVEKTVSVLLLLGKS